MYSGFCLLAVCFQQKIAITWKLPITLKVCLQCCSQRRKPWDVLALAAAPETCLQGCCQRRKCWDLLSPGPACQVRKQPRERKETLWSSMGPQCPHSVERLSIWAAAPLLPYLLPPLRAHSTGIPGCVCVGGGCLPLGKEAGDTACYLFYGLCVLDHKQVCCSQGRKHWDNAKPVPPAPG